ncbi:MAG: HlyD family efflux transporter periplasmic adaptor subunit, partial [Deltaproteobacteria bacterium]|nr:HlyD family efflux transporter periplasmic adaptor subunit [Deltaproteobacteria bacterium]
ARIDPTFISLELKANRAACARLKNLAAYWEHEVDRYRKLSGQKAVPLNRVEELEQKYDQARLQLAELEVKAEMLEERRRRCLIKAPPGWVLLERRAEPGEWLVRGRVVGRVGDYRTLLVPFSLTPAQYDWLRKKVEAGGIDLLYGIAKRKIPARLIHVSPAFNPKTRKIDIEFEVATGLDEKRGGIGLDLAIQLPEAGGVVVVPETALEERYDSCWLVREDGVRVEVVKLGRSPGGGLRVSGADLRPGDRIRCRK